MALTPTLTLTLTLTRKQVSADDNGKVDVRPTLSCCSRVQCSQQVFESAVFPLSDWTSVTQVRTTQCKQRKIVCSIVFALSVSLLTDLLERVPIPMLAVKISTMARQTHRSPVAWLHSAQLSPARLSSLVGHKKRSISADGSEPLERRQQVCERPLSPLGRNGFSARLRRTSAR